MASDQTVVAAFERGDKMPEQYIAPHREESMSDLLNIPAMRANLHATFNGGHQTPEMIRAFHHGMDTVCNVLEAQQEGRGTNGILPAAPSSEAEALRGALRSLRNEVSGALGIGADGIKEAIGNTNLRAIERRIAEADALLLAQDGDLPRNWMRLEDESCVYVVCSFRCMGALVRSLEERQTQATAEPSTGAEPPNQHGMNDHCEHEKQDSRPTERKA